ncbi:MAG: BACON domain-containing protein [Dokdonella sp.]|uniref:BACON domain-containing protein n=1 Tax=Dokdonella sp. TaxID=2291710 RepID=UPI003F80302C
MVPPESGTSFGGNRYRADGVAITLGRPAFRARPADAESMAREFVHARLGVLGLTKGDASELVRTTMRDGSALSVVRFRQQQEGLPVYGSDIAVSVAADGTIVHVANASVAGVGAFVNRVILSADEAVAGALAYLRVAEARYADTTAMAYVADDGTRHVWRVRLAAREGLAGAWDVVVDAQTGEILRAQDRAAYANGTGKVWTPDPLSYAKVAYGATGYVDGNNADTTQLTAALVPVTLNDITQEGSNWVLKGPYVVCAEIESPTDAACPSHPSTDFTVTRSAITFDAVMAYHHISEYMKYVNVTLGVPAMPLNHPGGIHVDPHGFGGDDNSRYDSGAEDLSFGEGGVDDAQDADVLIHELGHAIHDFITGGNLSQNEGLSEGFGDYTGGAWSRDYPNQWTPSDPAYFWIYSWDGHNPFWPGRVLNYQVSNTYAAVQNQEIHSAGQYWSSCNLVARDAFVAADPANGAKRFDKAYFTGLSMTGSNTNQKDAAQAVIDAAATLGYTQAEINRIGSAFNDGNSGPVKNCTYGVEVPVVTDDPVAQVAPGALDESVETGNATSTSLTISNPGGADLSWTLHTSDAATCATPSTVAWVALAPTSGTVGAHNGTPATVDVGIDASTLAPGSYSTYLCVHSNDPATPVVAVPLSLTVDPHPDLIFRSGFEFPVDPNIVDSGIVNIALPQTPVGVYIKWLDATTCTTSDSVCQAGTYNFNPWNNSGLSFFWPSGGGTPNGAVTSAGTYAVLSAGATIGAASTFATSGTPTAWRAGADGYLGFRFDCSSLGTSTTGTCYGYAHMTTTATTGFPGTLVQYWYDKSGADITIP